MSDYEDMFIKQSVIKGAKARKEARAQDADRQLQKDRIPDFIKEACSSPLDEDCTMLDAKNYVAHYLDSHGITVSAAGEPSNVDHNSTTRDAINGLILDYSRNLHLAKIYWKVLAPKLPLPFPIISDKHLMHAWADVIKDRRLVRLDAIVESVTAPPINTLEHRKVIDAILSAPTELDHVVFKHWIWQVKRKMLGLPVEYHLQINLQGRQESGKTHTVSRFLSPIAEVCAERTLTQLCDERHAYALTTFYVMQIDEMVGASKADIEQVKAIITKKEVHSRILGSNAHQAGAQNCTFISTSNQSIAEMINDSTGMRRFYEMTYRTDKEVAWKLLDEVNWLDVWRSVDHTQAEAFTSVEPYKSQLVKLQGELIQQSIMQMFFEAHPIEFVANLDKGIEQSEFLRKYKEFVHECGPNHNVSPGRIPQELKRMLGGDFMRGTSARTRRVHYNFVLKKENSFEMKKALG